MSEANMTVIKSVRLLPEDNKILKRLVNLYRINYDTDITDSGIMRLALQEYAENRKGQLEELDRLREQINDH